MLRFILHQPQAERARLQAIKDNDEEEYIRLLMEAKNERLEQLLNQTTGYMVQLGALVRAQQASARAPVEDADGSDEAAEREAMRLSASAAAARRAQQQQNDDGAVLKNDVVAMRRAQENYYEISHVRCCSLRGLLLRVARCDPRCVGP